MSTMLTLSQSWTCAYTAAGTFKVKDRLSLESRRCVCGHAKLGHGDRQWGHCISEVATFKGGYVWYDLLAERCDCIEFKPAQSDAEALAEPVA